MSKVLVVLSCLFALAPSVRSEDAIDRLKLDRLRDQRAAIESLRTSRLESIVDRPYRDYRANLHVHSAYSHDSRGKIEQIVASAKAALEEKLLELDKAVFAAIQAIPEEAPVGSELFRMQLDPYENSLKHVATHLLMKELSSAAVWESLSTGRAFVAFDWMADSNGFDLALLENGNRFEMGAQVKWQQSLKLQGVAPHVVHWKVFREGEVEFDAHGARLSWDVSQPGIYRVEAWLDLAGKEQIWILANPIYVRK